MQQANYNDQQ
jgi:hypothetical protein